MDEICSFAVDDGITVIQFLKMPDTQQSKAVLDELAANYPQQLRLWDMRDIIIDQDQLELQDIAKHSAGVFDDESRAAFVANDDLTFGILRMFEIYSEQQAGEARTRVFRSMDEARGWLIAEKDKLLD